MHMRCYVHILKLIMKDGMSVMDKGKSRFHNSVAFSHVMPKSYWKIENMTHAIYFCSLLVNATLSYSSTLQEYYKK